MRPLLTLLHCWSSNRRVAARGLATAGLFAFMAATPPALADSAGVAMFGRDTWFVAGESGLLRVDGPDGSLAGLTSAAFQPGPVSVSYVSSDSSHSGSVSFTIPSNCPKGPQALQLATASGTVTVANALTVADSALAPPSPAVLSPGQATTLIFAPGAFDPTQAQTIDLGTGVTVGAVAVDETGALHVPVVVSPSAFPGSRDIQLVAGSQHLVGHRAFGITPGPPRNSFPLSLPGGQSIPLTIPDGYIATLLAFPNPSNGLNFPDGSVVDGNDILYALNQEPAGDTPFTISRFDLSHSQTLPTLTDLDPAGRGGLLESGTLLPGLPNSLIYSTENYPTGGFPGGQTVQAVDRTTGHATVLSVSSDYNIDPISVGIDGNLVASYANVSGDAGVLGFDAQFQMSWKCSTGYFADGVHRDPLGGLLVLDGHELDLSGLHTYKGLAALDPASCSLAQVGDGPEMDGGGQFAWSGGQFGNAYYAPSDDGLSVYTWLPGATADSPWTAIPFAQGFLQADDVSFDREFSRLIVVDRAASSVIVISRAAGYQAPAPGSVVGQVLDAATGLPIAGVSVHAVALSASTDVTGFFTVPAVLPGASALAITRSGYLATSTTVAVSSNQQQHTSVGLKRLPFIDYDGDGRSDIGTWKQSTGTWYMTHSSGLPFAARGWGDALHNDLPVPGDYDGDGLTDIAVWRPTIGYWYIVSSSTGAWTARGWGDAADSDIPVPADYDGDGRTDIAIWRPAQGLWYVLRSSDGGWSATGWGDTAHSDVPVPADYDGDGKVDIAVWRPASGLWYVLYSSDGTWSARGWGDAADHDIPVPGDYDGDGKADLAVWRPASATWYVLRSSDGTWTSRGWGSQAYGDVPIPSDYDGDGKTDLAVWRPQNGYWYILNSADQSVTMTRWGSQSDGDVPNQVPAWRLGLPY